MDKANQIIRSVLEAKQDMGKADRLIRQYIPFIRSRVSKFTGQPSTGDEDENSIAMIAFHEAIRSYNREKGRFLAYAGLVIRSRLTDWQRKEAKHKGNISIYREVGDGDSPLHTTIADSRDHHEENHRLQATKEEIAELAKVMADFGLTFTDISENSPKQERTLSACMSVIRHGAEDKDLLDNLLKTKKLPITQLAQATGVEKKTLERHRKYILAMLLIQTNGYEIIRGHLSRTLKGKGGAPL